MQFYNSIESISCGKYFFRLYQHATAKKSHHFIKYMKINFENEFEESKLAYM